MFCCFPHKYKNKLEHFFQLFVEIITLDLNLKGQGTVKLFFQ